jgi:hypothetical protein
MSVANPEPLVEGFLAPPELLPALLLLAPTETAAEAAAFSDRAKEDDAAGFDDDAAAENAGDKGGDGAIAVPLAATASVVGVPNWNGAGLAGAFPPALLLPPLVLFRLLLPKPPPVAAPLPETEAVNDGATFEDLPEVDAIAAATAAFNLASLEPLLNTGVTALRLFVAVMLTGDGN